MRVDLLKLIFPLICRADEPCKKPPVETLGESWVFYLLKEKISLFLRSMRMVMRSSSKPLTLKKVLLAWQRFKQFLEPALESQALDRHKKPASWLYY